MSKNWIIEVLGDLRGFAKANNLPNLADQLEEVLVVAEVEIASAPVPLQAESEGAEAGRLTGTSW